MTQASRRSSRRPKAAAEVARTHLVIMVELVHSVLGQAGCTMGYRDLITLEQRARWARGGIPGPLGQEGGRPLRT